LAADFMDHGWDLRHLLRTLVTSRAYRQTSVVSPGDRARDPENLLLARSPSYRWPAEMIRDNALAVSDLLVNRLGGPPAKPYEVTVSFKPVDHDKDDGLYRRSLYTYWKRTAPAPVMMALDAPSREVCSVRRETTSTPMQAFIFMNDPQFVEAARKIAEKVFPQPTETVPEDGNQATDLMLRKLFRLLTSRSPIDREIAVLRSLYDQQLAVYEQDPDQARALLKTGLAPRRDGLPDAPLSAATVVASAMLSYDECVIKR
jgi:hypothetical protein